MCVCMCACHRTVNYQTMQVLRDYKLPTVHVVYEDSGDSRSDGDKLLSSVEGEDEVFSSGALHQVVSEHGDVDADSWDSQGDGERPKGVKEVVFTI